jgi:hypothetical protein
MSFIGTNVTDFSKCVDSWWSIILERIQRGRRYIAVKVRQCFSSSLTSLLAVSVANQVVAGIRNSYALPGMPWHGMSAVECLGPLPCSML